MNTPSITPAQIVAMVASILGLLVTLGVLDDETSKAILGVASTVVPVALLIVDSSIRRGRAANATAILHAKAVEAAARAERGRMAADALTTKRAPQPIDVEELGP